MCLHADLNRAKQKFGFLTQLKFSDCPSIHAAEKFGFLTGMCASPTTRRWCKLYQLVSCSRLTNCVTLDRARWEPAFGSDKMEHRKALFFSYIIFALLTLQIRCTLLLILMAILKGRQERHMLMEGYNNRISSPRFVPSRLTRNYRSCWIRARSKDWWDRVY